MSELSSHGIGVVTADPDLRYVGEGKTAVCVVNLAFNRSYQDCNKKWQQETSFVRCQAWGNRATKMAESVKKGQPVYVDGYLKQDSWVDKESGQKRVSYSLTIRDFQLCQKATKKSDASEMVAANVQQDTAPPIDVPDDNGLPF
jgi:single-strand DNA-binding protein